MGLLLIGLPAVVVNERKTRNRLGLADGFGRANRPGGSIGQGGFAAREVAAQPLASGLCGDALKGSGLRGIQALQGHLFDHLQSPGKGKSGMLMSVHPVGCPEWVGCLATSSLSNPTRMNTGYNLLNLHT